MSAGRRHHASRFAARALGAGGVLSGALLLCSAAAALAQAPAPAPGYSLADEGAYTLERMSVSGPTAARLRAVWDDAVAVVESSLGLAVPPRPHAIVAPTDDEFARRLRGLGADPGAVPADALAVAFAGRQVIVFRERGIAEGTPAGLEATLAHELAHLALGRVEAARGARLPRWLNEGLSEWASGRRPTRDEALTLASWAVHDELPSLEALTERFPPHGTGRAYLVALAFVDWLDRQRDGGGVRRLVSALQAGQPLDAALRAIAGLSPAEAEAAWHADLRADYSLAELLLRSVTVWSTIGVLAVLAILRHLWVRRRLIRRLEAEDAAAADEEPVEGPVDDGPPTSPGDPPGHST